MNCRSIKGLFKDFDLGLLVLLLFLLSYTKNLQSQAIKPVILKNAKEQLIQSYDFIGLFTADGSLFSSTDFEGKISLDTKQSSSTIYCINDTYNFSAFSPDTVQPNSILTLNFLPVSNLAEKDIKQKLDRVLTQLSKQSARKHKDYSYVSENEYELFTFNSLESIQNNLQKTEDSFSLKRLVKGEETQKIQFIHPDFFSKEIVHSHQEGGKDPIFNYLISALDTKIGFDSIWKLSGNNYPSPVFIANSDMYEYRLISEHLTSNNDSIYTFAFFLRKNEAQNSISGIFQYQTQSSNLFQILVFQSDSNRSLVSLTECSYSLTQYGYFLPSKIHTQFLIQSANKTTNFYASSNIQIADKKVNTGLKNISNENELVSSAFEITKSYEHRENQKFLNVLSDGFFPISLIDIDMSKFIGYNDFEGFKFGLGAQTNHKFSNRLGLAGSVGVGIWTKRLYYNYGFIYSLGKKLKMNWTVQRYADYIPSGGSGFELSAMTLFKTENFKNLYVNRMDFIKAIETSLNVLSSPSLKTQIKYSYQISEPGYDYSFIADQTQSTSYQKFRFNELTLKCSFSLPARTKPNQTIFRTKDQHDLVELMITYGNIPSFAQRFNYAKLEGRFKKYFLIGSGGILLTEISAAIVSQKVPYQKLFNLPGTWNRFGIYAPNSFATMKPNEFTADRYFSAAVVYTIRQSLRLNSFIQPRLSLMNQAIYGSTVNDQAHQFIIIKAPEKGFFEGGILINDLLKLENLRIGTGFFYRYGYYHLENEPENFRFKLVLGLGEKHNDNPSMY